MINPLNALKPFLDTNERQVAQAKKIVDAINSLEADTQKLSYADMQARIQEMRGELKILVDAIPQPSRESLRHVDKDKGLPDHEVKIQEKLWEFLPEVYAMVKEVYIREVGIKYYDEQMLAGVVLAQGQKLTELKTGEGKTYVFNLPMILYALVGRGSHLVTVNEYLVKRDAENAGHIASKLGLTVGIVAPNDYSFKYITDEEVKELKGQSVYDQEIAPRKKLSLSGMKGTNLIATTKKEAYNCDITVSVNSELGFDYLRDNMVWELGNMVQRELYFCVVDEADSILIDEARTPLIISAVPSESDTNKYTRFAKAVEAVDENKDFEVDYKTNTVVWTEDGIKHIEQILGVENIWADYSMVHHLENALRAKALFKRDDEYLVKDGEVLIVDSFTGRIMPGRRFSAGLHQAIEAKEGVEIKQEAKTYASITFQNFFRLYKILSGGSGTILTEAEEFYKIYHLESVVIPTHQKVIREDKTDLIFRDQDTKFRAVVKEIAEKHAKGQPVLVGTASVEKSEIISQLLDELRIPHSVLNAKYHDREAQIVAKAGEKGAVTVATNMAGRGTDIPLGEGVTEVGGLAVIGTERHEARRIDNQLRGRAGRQGDPGYSRFFVALDDNIMKIMGGDLLDKVIGKMLDPEAPIELGLITRQIETAQKRIEGANFDKRKNLVDYDDVMNKQREIFYSRRYKLLRLAEHSLNHFRDQEDTSLTAEQRKQIEQDSKSELQKMIGQIVHEDLSTLIEQKFSNETKLTGKDLEDFTAEVLDFAPDKMLAEALQIDKNADIPAELKTKLGSMNYEQAKAFLNSGFDRLLEMKMAEIGNDLPLVTKLLVLENMSTQWMEHLETMQDILAGVNLQGLAQRDPLVEYKNVGFRVFDKLMKEIDKSVARRFFKVTKVPGLPTPISQGQLVTNEEEIADIETGDRETVTKIDEMIKDNGDTKAILQAKLAEASSRAVPSSSVKKVGRNDPCPCGSGKKYKNCHGKNS